MEFPEATTEPAGSTAPVSARPAVDEQSVFRELCWIGGCTIALSVVYVVNVRLLGPSALGDTMAAAATAVIAVGGAFTAPKLVRSGFRLPTAKDLLVTLLVALLTASAVMVAFWLLKRLGFQFLGGYLNPYVIDDWPICVGYVNIAVVTPIAEEVLFRGVIQPKLGQLIKEKDALIVQAALFSALHLSPVILVTHFILGLAFGWLRLRTRSLVPGILLHAAWNAWVLWSSG
jgi:membrane protease YdiL (CAAX protease family)